MNINIFHTFEEMKIFEDDDKTIFYSFNSHMTEILMR